VVAPYSVTYDGNAHTATGTATGVKSESLSGLSLTGTTHTNAGTYATDPWTFTDSTGNYNNASGTVSDSIAKANATINVTPYSVTYDGYAHTATGTAKGVKSESLSGLDLSGTTHTNPGSYLSDPWTFTDSTGNYNNASGSVKDYILFASASSGLCDGDLSHTILQPINADGTSVFKTGSTVPTKFRVCDAFGNSVGPTTAFSNVVKSYNIMGTYGGTITNVDETVSSTTPDTTFRWDPTAQQWIFNTATGASTSLNSKNYTYWFQIVLIDGTIIGSSGTGGVIPSAPFAGKQGYQYGLK
jgi:hypothetical protein